MSRDDVDPIIDCLHKYFGFLFSHGYEIIHTEDTGSFDNVLIVLASKDAKIYFSQDRTEIDMLIGPAWAKNSWDNQNMISLDIILGLLESYDSYRKYPGNMWNKDGQVERLAELFYPRFEEIVSMFQIDTFPQAKKELHAHGKKMADKFMSRFEHLNAKPKSTRRKKGKTA